MSHPNPTHDQENVREADSKFAPKAKSKALENARIDKKYAKRNAAKGLTPGGKRRVHSYNTSVKDWHGVEKGPTRRGPAGMYN